MKSIKWIALVAFGCVSASANAANAQFLQTLNACLQGAESSLEDCAYVAAVRTRQAEVRLVSTLNLDPGRPEMDTRDNVEVCSNDGYDICDIYSCSESDGQSACDYIGTTCGEYWCN